MRTTGFLCKLLTLFAVLLFLSSLAASSVTLSTDSSVVTTGDVFRFILSADGSFESIIEPDFSSFDVENRSESQSSSISIINGKMESKKTINYTYHLRANKPGVFKIGPASIKLDKGKKIDSNVVTVTVTGSSGNGNTYKDNGQEEAATDENSVPTANALLAPLTTWEKKTRNYFLRAVVKPAGEVFEGEPVVVKYYLFTKPGAISDLNFYKLPSFEDCWKEEKSENRLTFKRGAIEGTVYDYGLLKTYLLIPEKDADTIRGTQMIVDVMTGSFFNTRKQSISTPALMIPLTSLPDKAEHPGGLFGNMTILTERKTLTLNKDNLLETVTYTISGCGDLQSAQIVLSENPDLKIFSPEVEISAVDTAGGYCGTKTYKFMIKGLRKGKVALKGEPLELYDRESGWTIVDVPEITVDIKEVPVAENSNENKVVHKYELLRELPEGVKKYDISPLVKRTWFRIATGIPFIMVIFSFMIWLIRSMQKKRSKSHQTKLAKWKERFSTASSSNELLNNFYDAIKELFSIELRGERKQNLKRKYGDSIEDVLEFIKEIERCSYSLDNDVNLSELKSKAVSFLYFRGRKK